MCDLNCVNLIDLSLEDDTPSIGTQIKTESRQQLSKDTSHFIPTTWHKQESVENNPFDVVQKQADRLNDPFDIVEKEANLKALEAYKPPADVKTGNLLSLSDDNLLDGQKMSDITSWVVEELNKTKLRELDSESPPIILNETHPPDSVSGLDTDSNPNSSAETSASLIVKKNMEYRKRLLKLSFSNVGFSSPIVRKEPLESEDNLNTPVSSILCRAAEFGEHLLASESPLKLVEDEDIMSEGRSNIDSQKNFEADLEMLQIPILNDLSSPAMDRISTNTLENSIKGESETSGSLENALPNIEAIRAKLKAKKDEANNNHQLEISSLIQNLKTLISSGAMLDNSKKQQANDLLESLSSAIKPPNTEETFKRITREGTFDMDLQKNQKTKFEKQPLVQEMPKCMVNSSATYDGETPDEKQDLNLPEIDPLSPQTSPRPCHEHNDYKNQMQTDVNDIMEQLSKLLIKNSEDNLPDGNNPTFIVVMNANQFKHSNINISDQNTVNDEDDSSPDITIVNPMLRRRAHSLSIHDKVKVVQLPLQQSTPRFIRKQHNVQMEESPQITTTTPPSNKMLEFKTEPRMMRRNSYSNGSPYTFQLAARRTGLESETKNLSQIRRTQPLDTHHEGQQQAIVRPMSVPSKNLPSYKPDLKKKTKHNTQSIFKSSVPLKATIPVKKVAPMLKTSPVALETVKKSHTPANISFQSLSKISKVPTTPLAAKGSSNLGVGVDYPNACSTPAVSSSPLQRSTGPLNKPRYSYMSATQSLKSPVINSASSASLKRRTITEFKAKSPLKSRESSTCLTAAAASSRVSIGSLRLSTSAGARISKTPVKAATVNTSNIKPTGRLAARLSIGGSALSAKYKENKRP